MKGEERTILWNYLGQLLCHHIGERKPTQLLSLQKKKSFIDNQIEAPYDKSKGILLRAVNLFESDPLPHSRYYPMPKTREIKQSL